MNDSPRPGDFAPESEAVPVWEILDSGEMKSAGPPLAAALGIGPGGKPVVCDIARMPHLLVAGQTGSGRIPCIHAMICSLLSRNGPDRVKLILVDPRQVELGLYNGVPHLLMPVVSEPYTATAALAWAEEEMRRRYDLFAGQKVRNIERYNEALEAAGEQPLPRVVVFIAELADQMKACPDATAEYAARVAQLARAAGIHLVISTHVLLRSVLTGFLRASFPSRIAFRTASREDSMLVLDRGGCEELRAPGEMLYMPVGAFDPVPVRGCFATREEIEGFVRSLREKYGCAEGPGITEEVNAAARRIRDGQPGFRY